MNTKTGTLQLYAEMEPGPLCRCVRVSPSDVFPTTVVTRIISGSKYWSSTHLDTFSCYSWFIHLFTESNSSCNEPPQVPHATIIYQHYKTVFPVDSKVQYQCEDGYTEAGGSNTKVVICLSGKWTDGPMCSKCTVWWKCVLFFFKIGI